jgi:hypothetical protein
VVGWHGINFCIPVNFVYVIGGVVLSLGAWIANSPNCYSISRLIWNAPYQCNLTWGDHCLY